MMEGKNNTVLILLVVLIGVFSGVGLLIGIGNAVGTALSPLNAKLTEISITQATLEKQVAALRNTGNTGGLGDRLDALQSELGQINQRLSNIGRPQQPEPPQEDYNKVYTLDPGASVILGNKNAPATLVEFSDFQCPYCARFYQVIKDIMAAYPDKVRVIIKNFPLPFHPNSRPAAKLALAANLQGKYQPMMEILLQNGADVSDAKIKEYAQKLGLNYNQLMADYKDKDAVWEKQLQDDLKLVSGNDVRGTPTFFINGRKPRGVDVSVFKAQIDEILKQK